MTWEIARVILSSGTLALCFHSAPVRAAELQAYAEATLVDTEYGDGDSFRVRFREKPDPGAAAGTGAWREEVIRLYYVDAPETSLSSESDRRRVLEQSRYFGLEDPRRVPHFGEAAKGRVRELLKKPFTVYTAFARAMGRSQKSRVYAMIDIAEGQDLAAVLVREGLARAHGVGRRTPHGVSAEEYAAFLDDLEMAAGLERAGVWSETAIGRIAELRRLQREEDRRLDEALRFGVFATVSRENPLDLNSAEEEELQQLEGIGPSLAKRIVEGRPYRSVEDVLRVKGIGEVTLGRIAPYLRVKGEK